MSGSRHHKTKEIEDNSAGDDQSEQLIRRIKSSDVLSPSPATSNLMEELAKHLRQEMKGLEALLAALEEYLAGWHLKPLEPSQAPMTFPRRRRRPRPPSNIAPATEIILRDYAELDLDGIREELQKRYNIRVEKKILRTILDRWLEDKAARPKFKRTAPSTYALLTNLEKQKIT